MYVSYLSYNSESRYYIAFELIVGFVKKFRGYKNEDYLC